MAMTLVEAMKLASSPAEKAIINEFIASELLSLVPFAGVAGGGVHYDQVAELPGVGFRGINEGYPESVGVLNPQSEALKIFGGDLDVDKFIIDTQGMQARAIHVRLKVEALRLRFERSFIKGDAATNPREFEGLQNRIVGNQLIPNANAGGPLSLNRLDRMIDRVRAGSGLKILVTNQAIKRHIEGAARNNAVGGHVNFTQDELGREAMFYRGARIITLEDDNLGNEIMPFTEASPDGSTTNNSSIYCVRFGDMLTTGIQGLSGIQVRDLGELNEKPVYRTRLDWYLSICIYNGRSVARLSGIQDAPAIA